MPGFAAALALTTHHVLCLLIVLDLVFAFALHHGKENSISTFFC
jgi:hypothetical protein